MNSWKNFFLDIDSNILSTNSEAYLGSRKTFIMDFFCKYSCELKLVSYFCKKLHQRCLTKSFLYTPFKGYLYFLQQSSLSCAINNVFYLKKKSCFVFNFWVFVKSADFKICDIIIGIVT